MTRDLARPAERPERRFRAFSEAANVRRSSSPASGRPAMSPRTTIAACVLASSIAWAGSLRAQEAPAPEAVWHEVDAEAVMGLLGALPIQRAGYRTPEDAQGLRRTEALVLAELRAMGYEPQTQDVPRPERYARLTPEEAPTPRNIWVDLPGQGELASEWIFVMAHTDAVVGSPGADDNGTGVVAL